MFRQELLARFARVGKAASHANRLELREFLAQRECSVEQLAGLAGLTVANATQQLRHAGLVATRRDGQRVIYRLSGDEVVDLLAALRRVAASKLADVRRPVDDYLDDRDHPVERRTFTPRTSSTCPS